MNSNDSESFGRIVRNALFIGIRAAWKSIECGIEASLTRRIRTRSPSRTRTTGPGTVPPNVQLLYVTPFAISTVASRMGMRNSFTAAVEAGVRRASYTGCVPRGVAPQCVTSTRGAAGKPAAARDTHTRPALLLVGILLFLDLVPGCGRCRPSV